MRSRQALIWLTFSSVIAAALLASSSSGQPLAQGQSLFAPALTQNLFVANQSTNTIREFSRRCRPGDFATAGLNGPTGLAIDKHGNLYVSNINGNTIREFSPTGDDLGNFATTGLSFSPWHRLRQARQPLCGKRQLDSGVLPDWQRPGQLRDHRAERRAWHRLRQERRSLRRQCWRQHDWKFSRTGEDLGIFATAGLSLPRSLPSTREAICTSPTLAAIRFASSRRLVQTWATSPPPG